MAGAGDSAVWQGSGGFRRRGEGAGGRGMNGNETFDGEHIVGYREAEL